MDVVGKSVKRVDAYDKVSGKAIYPQDIYIDNMLYGATLRSTKPHAYIKVDISKALELEGIIKIFTAKDIKNNYHGVVLKDHQVFCENKVRRVGDPIAFVVAISKEVANMALEYIRIDYEEIECVFDP